MKIDWTMLNAYVDGELDAAAAAAVAAAVAASPDLAARVASLNRLKTESARLAAPRARPAVLPRARHAAIAALIALVVAAGALGLWQPWHGIGDPVWLAEAVTTHEGWLARSAAHRDGSGHVGPAAMAALPPTAGRHAPDLSAARLSLVYAETRADGSFFGYEGIHGCHVGLWTAPAGTDLPAPDGAVPHLVQRDGIHAFVWHDRGERHLLMARGMPDVRLGRLADLVATIIERDQRLDERLRLALQATTGMAPPCA